MTIICCKTHRGDDAFAVLTLYVYMFFLTSTVAIGRFVMGLFWMTNPPEIYTAAIGLYSLWLIIRISTSLYSYITDGATQLMTQVSFFHHA